MRLPPFPFFTSADPYDCEGMYLVTSPTSSYWLGCGNPFCAGATYTAEIIASVINDTRWIVPFNKAVAILGEDWPLAAAILQKV